jgi:hypothetical protein
MKTLRMASLASSVTVVVGAWVAVACSSSSSGSGAIGTEGGAPGPQEDGGGGGGRDALAGKAGGGQLSLYSAKSSSSFVAAFAPATPGEGITSGCTIEPVGPCKLISCQAIDAAARPAAKLTSAGTITATGGLLPAAGISIMAAGDGTYTPVTGTVPLWAGGDTLTFTAAGGPVPGFTKTAVAPAVGLSITMPTIANGGAVAISRSSDFVIGWAVTGAAVGKTAILVGGTGGKSLSCSFDVAGMSGTIPTAALGKLEAGPGSFTFAVFSSTTTTVGDYALTIELTTPSTAAGEEFSFANATLQ